MTDLPVALALLTRLPLPRLPDAAFGRQARAVWAFPFAGLAVGAMGALAAAVATALGLPPSIAAGLCLMAQALGTGAMHEDGLADTADGFWGGWTVERRLEIMKDSRIGTYGVLALILTVGLRWMALGVVLAISVWPVLAVAVLSRAGLPVLMAAMSGARPGGLSDKVGRPVMGSAVGSVALGLVLAGMILPAALPALLLATILGLAGMAALAWGKIRGQTGDVLGATQQVTEVMGLLALAAILSSV